MTESINIEYVERLRWCAKDAEEEASKIDDIAYAQGAADILGYLLANPTGKPVDLGQVGAGASQLAEILQYLEKNK